MKDGRNGRFGMDVYYLVPLPPSLRSSGIMELAGFFHSVFESKGLISKYSGIRTYGISLT
jgi:hypothetical protein